MLNVGIVVRASSSNPAMIPAKLSQPEGLLPTTTAPGQTATMASACSIPRGEAEASIRKTGVYSLGDIQVGAEVAKFRESGLPTKTPYGLDFCAQNSLDNQVRY